MIYDDEVCNNSKTTKHTKLIIDKQGNLSLKVDTFIYNWRIVT